jgi:hypothetical protein
MFGSSNIIIPFRHFVFLVFNAFSTGKFEEGSIFGNG